MSSPSNRNRETTPSEETTRELVFYCTVCFTPLAASGAGVGDPPYWLTSCGHIVCSSHVFPDGVPPEATQKTHTCPHCQRTDISLAGVNGSEPPEGLRDYFTPQLELLDNFTGALRFQYDNAIRAANHYKRLVERLQGKLDNQKSVLLRVRDELLEARELKKEKPLLDAEITRLREENERLRSSPGTVVGDSRPAQRSPVRHNDDRNESDLVQDAQQQQNQSNGGQKRKADVSADGARVRDFRRELNNRSAMPPPPLPPPQPPHPPPPPPIPPQKAHNQQPQHQNPQSSVPERPQLRSSYENEQNFDNSNLAFQRPANPYPSSVRYQQNSNSYPTMSFQQQPQAPNRFSRQDFSIPPSTPRAQQPFFNTPFRLPTRNEAPLFQPQQQQLGNNFFPQRTAQPQIQTMISPTGNAGGRLSLAPQSSHGGRFLNTLTTERPGTSSPYFTRTGLVAQFANGRAGGSVPLFGGGYSRDGVLDALRERGGSIMASRAGTSGLGASSTGRFGNTGIGGGGGGLNEILRGGEGFMERPGLRRAVRRE